ncbi:hypothetical protein H0H93_014557 [Arthromyces matolae]|nr:hypothetical protein H0H93_014557 [Arthromyces matolae]
MPRAHSTLLSIILSSKSSSSSSVTRDPIPKPWDDWQLDPTFLKAVNEWSNKNPESTLSRILEGASLAIDQGKDFLEIIPDAPFPAKSLVKAVLQLVKLGANVSLAHLNLLEFAKDITEWVEGVASSFALAGDGEFTKKTWDSLAKVRELIDEICAWATSRLARFLDGDGRMSPSNLKVNNEISDFKNRLNEARQIFRDRTLIGLSGGFDLTLRKIGTVLGFQDKITRTLRKIKKTQDDHYRRLMDELQGQKETQARQKFLQTFLNPHTAERLAYHQQEKMPCDEETRVEVLSEIRKWVNDVSSSSKNFLWLTGDPGCGKSAVTASVARECKDRKVLWAQFFINRNIKDTTNPNLYFPSIARQLADYSDLVERQVHFALVEQPSLIDEISSIQATKLFVDTLAAASRINTQTPVVVVIDGLDETQREHLESTATIFAHLFDALAKYRNAKVFISSRTENDIQKPFSRAMKDKRVLNLHLDTNSESSLRDVDAYLRRRITQTALKHHLDPTLWPGEERLAALSSHASGHFIWAVTVSRFLHEQMDEWGHECLDTVMLNLGTAEGKQDIKVLYGLILQLSYQKSKDPWAFETFRRVVGAIATALEPLSIWDFQSLLDLRRDPSSAPVDLHHFVRRLRTVLVSGTDDITGQTVSRLHKSFFEYITSENCDERFRVSLEDSNAELAVQCLRQILQPCLRVRGTLASNRNISSADPLPVTVRYALRFYASHFPDGTPVEAIIDHPKIVDPLQLINALLSRGSFYIIDGHAPTLYLNYSESMKQISCSDSIDNYTLIWNSTSGEMTGPRPRPSVTIPTSETEGPVTIKCIAVSPDGTRIATCTFAYSSVQRGAIHIWDATTLQLITSCGLDADPGFAVFSQNGERVAMTDTSSRRLGTVHVFNLKTNSCVQENRRELIIDALAFSLDGSLELVCTESSFKFERGKFPSMPESKIAIVRWVLGGLPRPKLEQSDNLKKVFSISISPGCQEIIAVTDVHILVWDFDKSTLIHKLPTQPGVRSAIMSHDKDTMVLEADSLLYIGHIKPFESWKRGARKTEGGCIRLSPKKDLLLSWSRKEVHLIDLFTQKVWLHLDFSTTHSDPQFSCDGEHIFVPNVSQIEKIDISHIASLPRRIYIDTSTTPRIHISKEAAPNHRLETVRWYMGSSQTPGFWAFIDGHLIRGSGDGSFAVIPVNTSLYV